MTGYDARVRVFLDGELDDVHRRHVPGLVDVLLEGFVGCVAARGNLGDEV